MRTFRTSLNLLGDGFVEAIPNETLLKIAADQPNDVVSGHLVQGQAIRVPIEELPPDSRRVCRIGRFGHKDQHASLLSFSGDAYLNEMGITNRLFLMENNSLGRPTAPFDPIPNDSTIPCDPVMSPPPGQNTFCGEDPERDIDIFTQFMRATKAPARDKDIATTDEAMKGSELFDKIGCAVCHVRTLVTAQEGVLINGGTFKVPEGARQQDNPPVRRLPPARHRHGRRHRPERRGRRRASRCAPRRLGRESPTRGSCTTASR